MKPAARAVLESLRSAAHQVPQYFKGKKPRIQRRTQRLERLEIQRSPRSY
ncbi:Hypothetical protein FKW44_003155 [Caligus rogercresseyi]|uniref:Uncharacterized protein n=1 Tax=Caligus rogercresseyi TaxID=217165 RepID=A0A7T8QWU6_CALRO|nr:Hypothetical protein FKW44_003155 [Caligus rogercresseyi]